MTHKTAYLIGCFFLFVLIVLPGTPMAAAPYYEGKVLTIIVGYPPGGGYDRVARFLANHLPKYIPGKPSIVVQNMPGASSMIAGNHLYNVAKPDGLTILATQRGLAFMELLKVEGVKFNVSKFTYIGSAAAESNVFCIRADLPYKTIQDLLKSKQLLYIGVDSPTSVTAQTTHLGKDFMGMNIKIVDYRGTPEILLAIERKEADGLWFAYNSARPHIERGLLRALVRSWVSLKGIENLPINEDLTTDPIGKALMGMLGRSAVMGRPYLAPPGVPANIANILRDAFAKMLADPQIQKESEKAQMELSYASAEECVKLMNYLMEQPPDVVKAFAKYVKF